MTVLTAPPPTSRAERHRWWILAVIAVAQLTVALDVTVVNIALPSAQRSLGFSDDDRQWVVTAYSLAFGGLLLLGGKLGDLLGRKLIFIVGLVGFALSSTLGGIANGFDVLVIARALQGAFAALLAPAALSLLSTTFTDPDERGRAFGIFAAVAGGGGAVGLLLGGALTEYLSWRWCLFINIMFAVPVALAAVVLLHSGADNRERARLDIPGTVLACTGLVAIVYGFSRAERYGWSDDVTLGLLGAGVLLLALFVWSQSRVRHPLMPLRILADRDRGASYLVIGISGAGMFAVFLFLTYYLQQTLHYKPITTGLAFLPMIVALTITAAGGAGKLMPKVGHKPLMTVGGLLATGGMVLLAQIEADSTYAAHVLPGLVIVGLGLGLIIAPAMDTATAGVQAHDSGVASALVNTTQQVGGSLGVALLNGFAATASSDYLAGRAPTPEALAGATAQASSTAFWWAAGIFAAATIVSALLPRFGVREASPAGAAVVL